MLVRGGTSLCIIYLPYISLLPFQGPIEVMQSFLELLGLTVESHCLENEDKQFRKKKMSTKN